MFFFHIVVGFFCIMRKHHTVAYLLMEVSVLTDELSDWNMPFRCIWPVSLLS